MADVSAALFAAIFAKLRDDTALTALIGAGRVHDHVAAGSLPPYVVIGDETANDYGATLVDAQEHTVTLHVWSEQPSTLQVKRIMAAVRAALHEQPLTLSAGACVQIRQEFKETFRDPDGVSHHGVMRFRAVTQS